MARGAEGLSPVFENYPCPCCGHLVFTREPGNHERCPICGWEDDMAQLRFPLMPGSSNRVSLQDAQQNYRNLGVAERRHLGTTREPFEDEPREAAWRPLDTAIDNVEEPRRGEDYAESYPTRNPTVLYYWRGTYWRRFSG